MAKPKASTKVRKKIWLPLVAPKLFSGAALGESCVYTEDQLVGKRVRENLMNLTGDIKRQNVTITFEVTDVKENKGQTSVVSYNMLPSSFKRMVRRRSDKIALSFTCETSDKKLVRVKSLLVTRGNTTGVVKNKMRVSLVSSIVTKLSKMTYDNALNELIQHKFQSDLKSKMSKIHPAKLCEISSFALTSGKTDYKSAAVEAKQAEAEA